MFSKRVVRKSVAVIAFGFLISTIIVIYSDVHEITDIIRHIDLRYMPLVLLIMPLNYFVKYIRYHYYLRLVDLKIKVKDEVYSLMAASVMVITPGKLGEVFLRGYLLKKKRYDVSMLEICAMTIADRLTEGLAMAVLAIITLSDFSDAVKPSSVYLSAAILIFFVIILQNKKICLSIIDALKNIPHAKKVSDFCKNAYSKVYVIFKIIPILLSTFLGMISWCCEAGVIYLFLLALGDKLAFSRIVFSISISGILGAVSMIPGGVGVADGALLGLLIWCGLGKTSAGAAVIISRFSTMWLGVCVGIVFLLRQRSWLWV